MADNLPVLTQDQIDQMGLIPQDEYLKGQGQVQPTDGKQTVTRAAINTLKAHAGGIAGGGAATLGTGALLAPWLAGPEAGVPADIAMLLASGIAGAGGSYAGQKAQKALESPDTYNAQQSAAQEAEVQHPLVSGATDIAVSALASGGLFSPTTALQASRGALSKITTGAMESGDAAALKNVALQSVVNPAINSGIDYATTGELPSGKDLATQAAGGVLFAKPSFLGTLGHRPTDQAETTEPAQEPNQKEDNQPTAISPWKEQDENGNYNISDNAVRQAWMEQHPKPKLADITDPVAKAQARTAYDTARTMPTDQIRDQLHNNFLAQTPDTKEPDGEPLKMVAQDGVTTPIATPNETAASTETPNTATVGPNRAVDFQKAILERDSQEQDASKMGTQPPKEGEETVTPKSELDKNVVQTPQTRTKYLNENALKIVNPNTLLQSQVARPEVKPTEPVDKILPVAGQRTPEEQIQDKLEGNGSVYSPKGWDQIEPSAQPYNKDHIAVPASLMGHIRSGKATTGTVLHSLANTPGHQYQELAGELLKTSDPQSLQKSVSVDNNSDRSYYRPDTSSTHIALPQLNDGKILMHELVHSMTSNKLPNFGKATGDKLRKAYDQYLSDPKGNEAVKDLMRAHMQVAAEKGHHDIFFGEGGIAGNADKAHELFTGGKEGGAYGYGMGNLHEFISEAFTSKVFQKHLENIQDKSGQTKQSVWDKIVNAVRKLLGVSPKNGTMLERVLHSSSELINSGKEDNAIQKQSSRKVLQREQEENGETGSERERMESGKQRNVSTRQEGDISAPPKKKLEDPHMGWLGNTTRSMISKIRDIAHPSAKIVADAFHNVLNERQSIIGHQLNPILQAAEKYHLKPSDEKMLERVSQYERQNGTSGKHLLTTEAQKKVYKIAKKSLEDNFKYRLASKEPVIRNGKPTLPVRDEFYWPTTTNPKIAQTYRTNTDPKEIARLDKVFLQHQLSHGVNAKDAQENLQSWKVGVQGSSRNAGTVGNQQFFNASRRAQGIPLPAEFTRPGFMKNMEAYFHRQAIDNAHYKYVEANPKVMSALGETRNAWNQKIQPDPNGGIAGNSAVQHQLREFHGETGGAGFHNEKAASSLATSVFIASPALEFHKVMSNIVGLTAYADNPYQLARILGNSIKNIREGYQHAIEQGATKLTAKSWGDMMNGNLAAADRLQSLAQSVRKISTLNDLTTKWGTGLVQAASETIVPSKLQRANNGDVGAQKFIQKLDPNYKIGKQYNTEQQQALAAQLTGYIHGTSDGRTMPAWMSGDSEVSGFFKLAHWSIAQTNRFMSDVYSPATRGDLAPLLHSMFGAAIGGYLIKEVREKIQGKKSPIPSLSEIGASDKGFEGNKSLIAYNMIAAAQYSGFGGILSQIAKYPFDFVYKNAPQGATFPMDEVATDLASTLHNVSESIANDPNVDWTKLAQTVSAHIFTSNFQLGRIAYNQSINNGLITGTPAEKKVLGDQMNQLRRFDMVEGLPYNDIDEGQNPYMNLEQKSFKSEQNIGKAMQELPQLIGNIVSTYHDRPDVMIEKLKGLKENQYATFPSMDTMPLSFMKYLSYLNREEGPEQAQAQLHDYMMHKVTNEAKSSVIP